MLLQRWPCSERSSLYVGMYPFLCHALYSCIERVQVLVVSRIESLEMVVMADHTLRVAVLSLVCRCGPPCCVRAADGGEGGEGHGAADSSDAG